MFCMRGGSFESRSCEREVTPFMLDCLLANTSASMRPMGATITRIKFFKIILTTKNKNLKTKQIAKCLVKKTAVKI